MSLLSHLLYWIGCLISLLLDAVADDWPRAPDWLVDRLWRAASWVFNLSSNLDQHESVWLRRAEGETDEAFERRRQARWPDSD